MKTNIAKELRSKRMKYINEMTQVKSLKLLPNLDLVTIGMAAEYFETDYSAISSYYSTHKKELEEYGIIKLYEKNFEDAGYSISDAGRSYKFAVKDGAEVKVGHTGLRCMSEAAVFNMSLGLMCSDVADKIREAVKKVEASDNENVEVVNEAEQEVAENPEVMDAAVYSASDIRVFTNVEFGDVRIVIKDGDPWFVGKDVADILGYTNSRKSLNDHVDVEDKNTVTIRYGTSGNPNQTVINESGLYSLIISSKLPSAKKFKRWVTSEVLPSIRKNGGYIAGQEELSEAELMAKAIMVAQKTIEEREKRIAELSVTNKALTDEINTWEPKSVINALIRSYAACCFNNNYAKAFNDYYKQLSYKHHINVKTRRTNSKDSKELPLIEYIREDEMDNAVKLAVAICEACGINTGKVINEVNCAVAAC